MRGWWKKDLHEVFEDKLWYAAHKPIRCSERRLQIKLQCSTTPDSWLVACCLTLKGRSIQTPKSVGESLSLYISIVLSRHTMASILYRPAWIDSRLKESGGGSIAFSWTSHSGLHHWQDNQFPTSKKQLRLVILEMIHLNQTWENDGVANAT